MLAELTGKHGALLRSYVSTLGGSAGRLVISLLYFVSLANSLSISDFGLFASASAAGIVLSRIISFGFVSPLYRTATVKPQLLGTYYAGYLVAALLSLPVAALAGWIIFHVFFADLVAAPAFAAIIISEVLLWRSLETIVIVNNGLNRFGRAAMLVVIGTALRALAPWHSHFPQITVLASWVFYYLGANALSLAAALIFYLPRRRLRFRPKLYLRRAMDALWTCGAEDSILHSDGTRQARRARHRRSGAGGNLCHRHAARRSHGNAGAGIQHAPCAEDDAHGAGAALI